MADDHVVNESEQTPYSEEEQIEKLRYWLANEDIYTSDYVRGWLQRTPPEMARGVLTGLAQSAALEPHSLLHLTFHGFLMCFSTSEYIRPNSAADRRVGTRAALLLAEMRDRRAVAPLATVFETERFWETKYQEAIEAALGTLIEELPPSALQPAAQKLREIVLRIWSSGNGRRELTDRRADLLIALIERLSEMGGGENADLLSTIASSRVFAPNRLKVKESAAKRLGRPA